MTAPEPTTAVERDPVCGMNVNPATSKHVHEHQGSKFYFCCAHCVEKFKSDPGQYLDKRSPSGLVALGMPKAAPSASAERDPVCGMSADAATAKYIHEYSGKRYYFCSAHCLEKFQSSPQTYLDKAAAPKQPAIAPQRKHPEVRTPGDDARSYVCPMCPEVRESKPVACPSCGMALERDVPIAASRTEYTCPMHPEIVRSEPGSCPICGMALEPRTMRAGFEENPELRDMSRRFWISLVLTVPLLAIAMGSMIWHGLLGESRNLVWIEFALSTPVVLWCGLPFFQRFWTSLVNRSPNMFTLIGLGTGVAYLYSVVATVAPQVFPPSLRVMDGYPDVYFEAAAAITALVLLGQVMELRARSRTSAAIRALLDLGPKTARLISNEGSEKDIPLEQVKPEEIARCW